MREESIYGARSWSIAEPQKENNLSQQHPVSYTHTDKKQRPTNMINSDVPLQFTYVTRQDKMSHKSAQRGTLQITLEAVCFKIIDFMIFLNLHYIVYK